MESLANFLQPYKEIVGISAATITFLQFFSGVFVINDVRKKGNTDGFPAFPFLAGSVFCILNIQFGQMIRDDATIKVNFSGLALNLVYIMFFYVYTTGAKKMLLWAKIGMAGIFAFSVLYYVQIEDPKVVEFRFGMILTLVLFSLIGMPLLGLGEIMRKKSTEGLPFPIILSGALVSLSWLVYGIILRNNFIVVQNVIAFGLGFVQLLLFIIYPSTPAVKAAKKKN